MTNPTNILLDALSEIAKAEGPYSQDRLKHAENTIGAMAKAAKNALDEYREATRGVEA